MTKVINLRKYTKSKTNKRKNDFVKSSIKEEKYKVILLVISVFSILLGCLIFKYYKQDIIVNFDDYISMIKTYNFIEIFLGLIRFDICFLVLIFFIGTSFVGKLLIFIPPILKSLVIGYISSYIYCEYKTNGIMFCLIILYPYLAITTSTLIFGANESAFMSNYVRNVITHKNTADDMSIKLYIMRYLILIGINIVCALINSIIVTFLGPKINLL